MSSKPFENTSKLNIKGINNAKFQLDRKENASESKLYRFFIQDSISYHTKNAYNQF